jgi:hypothetical protein
MPNSLIIGLIVFAVILAGAFARLGDENSLSLPRLQ